MQPLILIQIGSQRRQAILQWRKAGLILTCILGAMQLTSQVQADLHGPTPGAIQARLEPQPQATAALESGQAPFDKPLEFLLSFTLPAQASQFPNSPARARVIFDAIDSDIQWPGLNPQQIPSDLSSEFENPSIYEVSLAQVKPGDRVRFPLNWLPKGRFGAGLRARVLVTFGPRREWGHTAYTVGVIGQGAGRKLKKMNTAEILMKQRADIAQDRKGTAARLISLDRPNETAPFIPANHSAALSQESPEFSTDGGAP